MIAKRLSIAGLLLPCLAAALLASSCGRAKKEAAPPRKVKAAAVERGTISREVLFTGNIVAKDFAEVYPRASGRVSKKLLKEGDPVRKGQAIMEIERDEVGFRFRPLAVDSPIDGYVGTIGVDVGEYVHDRQAVGAKPVAVVVRPGTMRAKLDVPERYLGAISPGDRIELSVDSLDGAKYEATVVSKSAVVGEKTRTANVEAELANADGRLRHGMFGRTKIAVEKREGVLVVPKDAVSWEADKRFVYRIVDGKAVRTQVETGLRNETKVEVISGLSEGEKVVVGGLIDIKDGESVEEEK